MTNQQFEKLVQLLTQEEQPFVLCNGSECVVQGDWEQILKMAAGTIHNLRKHHTWDNKTKMKGAMLSLVDFVWNDWNEENVQE